MIQFPLLSGTYTDNVGNMRTSYPHNLVPVPLGNGVSEYFLRPAEGITQNASIASEGFVRGGINWNGVLYRVVGSDLVSIDVDGNITTIGSVGNDQRPVKFDYSFDRLSITSNADLFYYSSALGLIQVTDSDLGDVIDHIWVDGYFMAIDDENIVVTDLADPTAVDPLKYGSSEADPDDTIAILKVRNEPHVINRYTIEVFQNVGGSGFPFSVVQGATVRRGAVGTYMCTVFKESLAFVGSGRNESVSVWMSSGGNTVKIATREIDLMLHQFSEDTLSNLVMEDRTHEGLELLYIHLPTITLVYDAAATQETGQHVWYTLGSGIVKETEYEGRYHVWCYNRWNVGSPNTKTMGYLVDTDGDHFGVEVAWQFDTDILYNEGMGALMHELELVALTGRIATGTSAVVQTQWSYDGQTWSMVKAVSAGTSGNRSKRLVWLQQGHMKDRRIQRFKGTSDARLTFLRLNARIEPLGV